MDTRVLIKEPEISKKKDISSANGTDLNGFWHVEKMQIGPYLSPFSKLKSKWITNLNIKPDTLNIIEEKVGSSFEHIGTKGNFLNRIPIAQALRTTINK